MPKEKAYQTTSSVKIDDIGKVITKEIARHDDILNKLHLYIKRVDKYLSKSTHLNNIDHAECQVEIHNPDFLKRSANAEVNDSIESVKQKEIICKQHFIEKCSHVYTFLEFLIKDDAYSFSNSKRGKLRKAQGDIQRIRLWLNDVANAKASIV